MGYLSRAGVVLVATVLAHATAEQLSPPNSASNPLRIWDDAPGGSVTFSDKYPIGNGRIGAMFSGDPQSDSLPINENSFWSGSFIDRINPDSSASVKKMQKMIRNGQFLEAEDLGALGYVGMPTSTRNYDTLGTLSLTQTLSGNVTDYERWLDVKEAVGGIYFKAGGVTFQREYIASNPDDIIAINFKASKAGSLNFRIRLDRGAWDIVGLDRHVLYSEAANGNAVIIGGQSQDTNPIVYAAGARIAASGGKVSTLGDNVICEDADEATVYFQSWTNYRKKDPKSAVLSDLAAVSTNYEKIRDAHCSDFEPFLDRVSLNLGTSSSKQKSQTTPQRMVGISPTDFDPELAALYYQFGRYLLISSSRSSSDKSLPPNLQGVWNDVTDPPWGGKYTVNINLQMNYWPSLSTGLSDLVPPLNNLLKTMGKQGSKVAKEMYGCQGTLTHHNTDMWGDSAPQDNYDPATFWPMGAAWMITHVIEHYRFTGDKDTLRDMFPTLKANAEFLLDFMTEYNGYMVTNPSVSPENTYIIPNSNGQQSSITLGPTIDNSLASEILGFIPEAQAALGIHDDAFAARAAKMRAQIPGLRTNQYGGIAEWMHNYEEALPGNGHMSHLVPAYPLNHISSSNKTTFDAAIISLNHRLDNGGGPCGWPRAWTIALSGRLFLPNITHQRFVTQMSECSWNQTMLNVGGVAPFQIDGNFGVPAGVTEALIQSQEAVFPKPNKDGTLKPAQTGDLKKSVVIRLLPSVPEEWGANGGGGFDGIQARGGFSISASWDKNGKLKKATITSLLGNDAYVTLGQTPVTSTKGQKIKVSSHGSGVFVGISGKKGSKFTVTLE